jgi:gluconolactonase
MNRFRWQAVATATVLVCCIAVAQDKEKGTNVVDVKEIKLTVPKAWKQEKPSNQFRVAQFKIAPVEGDKEEAELVITQFGGGGGGVNDNIKRWENQFEPKDRKIKVTKGKSKLGEYVIVDGTGTYLKPDGPPIAGKTKPTPGSRVLNVMLMIEEKGVYFLKLAGPEKTVTGTATDLRTSFGAKAEDEKEYKPE